MLKDFVQSNSLLVQKPIFIAKFWPQLIQITENVWEILDRNINLGNFVAVKILEGTVLLT